MSAVVETVTRSATVDGEQVTWRVAGSGPPLVLVHGLSGSWRWWQPVLERLGARHELHLLDLPRADRIARERGGDTVNWLAAWLDAAGIESPSLVGHSLGGLAAARLAVRRPERIDRLVLVAPVGIPTGRRVSGHALPLVLALMRTRTGLVPQVARDAVRTGPSSLLRGALEATRADLRAELAEVRAPTLLVWGERDPLLPPAAGDAWRAGLADARLAVLPGAGHVPMWEAPAQFASAVLDFLGGALDERSAPVRR